MREKERETEKKMKCRRKGIRSIWRKRNREGKEGEGERE